MTCPRPAAAVFGATLTLPCAARAAQVVTELMKVHGVGKVTAMEWYTRGIRSIDDALEAGVMNETQKLASRFWRDLDERIPRAEVEEIARAVRGRGATLERPAFAPRVLDTAERVATGRYGAVDHRRATPRPPASPAPFFYSWNSQGVCPRAT